MNENNATLTLEDYNNVIFSLCSKKTTKYDIYLYYDFDIQAITSHLVNIKDYVDDDFINRFPPELINNSKTADGRVVGIVIIKINSLYYHYVNINFFFFNINIFYINLFLFLYF